MNTTNRILLSAAAAVFAFVAMAELLSTLDIESNKIAGAAAIVILFVTWSMTRPESARNGGTSQAQSDITPITPHYGDSP